MCGIACDKSLANASRFYPVNSSILKILIQTIIMNTPQSDPVFPFPRFPVFTPHSVIISPVQPTVKDGLETHQNSKELLDGINPIVV